MGSGDPRFEPASKGFFEFLVESCPCGRAEICRPSQRPLPTAMSAIALSGAPTVLGWGNRHQAAGCRQPSVMGISKRLRRLHLLTQDC